MRGTRSLTLLSTLALTLLLPFLTSTASAQTGTGGGVLAYTWQPLTGGLHEIHVINVDGSGERLLIDEQIGLNHHEWSPDARHIATVGYIGTNNTTWSIHVVEVEGGNLRRLTTVANVWDSEPTWSPDGQRIAFCRIDPNNGFRSEIWVMNADGSDQHWIGQLGFAPRWSPDGTRFVYQSSLMGSPDILTCATEGSDVQVLFASASGDYNPDWSPDGNRIAFTIGDGEELSTREIWVMDTDGGGAVQLTDNGVSDDLPRWSPDGTMLAFHSDLPGHVEIYVMDADGTDRRRVTTMPANVTAINPSWCPTLSGPHLGQAEPGVVLERFPPFPYVANGEWFWHGAPAFSPDGQELYWARYDVTAGGTDIYVTTVENGTWTWPRPADFSSGSFSENCPAFSSTGDTLYFQSSRPGGNVFRVERIGFVWSVPTPLALPIPSGTQPGLQFSVARNGDLYGELWVNGGSDLDLYRWRLEDGAYAEPEDLGPTVNSDEYDFMPFVDPRQRFLLFSSGRSGGMGMEDVWYCRRSPGGGWEDPVNAGPAINTESSEVWTSLSPGATFLFVTSGREGDQGFNPYWIRAEVLLGGSTPTHGTSWSRLKSSFGL